MRARLLIFIIGWLSVSARSSADETTRPWNVVLMVADDLGWGELGCYGQKKIPTPHLDRLASEGMRFTQHYSGAPTCAPSRCVLMTGRHLGHADIRGNRQAEKDFPQFTEGQHPLYDATVTLAEAFREAGYATAAFGKWGLGPVGSSGDPNRQGFDLFFGYNCQSVAHSYFPSHLWRNQDRITLNTHPISAHPKLSPEDAIRAEQWQGEVYAPTRMLEEALAFVEANRDRPFFLYLPFIEPHLAMHPPLASVDRFPREWDDEPYRGESGYLPHPRPRAAYAAMISDLDDHVGRVLHQLQQLGLAERTLVIFTSDNGTTHMGSGQSRFHVGGVDAAFFESTAGLRGYKGSLYEGGIRVPTIVKMPGKVPSGTTTDFPSYFADWFPTLADATQVKDSEVSDGLSLWPVLTGQAPEDRTKPMVWVYSEYGGQVAVRMGSWKAIRRQLLTPNADPWELYDLDHDRGEQINLADQHPERIAEAIEILKRETAPNETFPMSLPGAE